MILGCGRSGTSIFGELFEHIPVYTYRSEPPFEDVMAADYGRPQAFKVPRDSDRFGKPEPGLSFPLPAMRALRPDMRFFWIVRHPLDAISSLRVGIAQNWGHHPRPPDWQDWLGRPLVEQCAHHWAFLNRAGYGQVKDVATVVKFEDMIADPAGFAARRLPHGSGSTRRTSPTPSPPGRIACRTATTRNSWRPGPRAAIRGPTTRGGSDAGGRTFRPRMSTAPGRSSPRPRRRSATRGSS